MLAGAALDEEVIRAFDVGFAPVGPDELMEHLRELGYSVEEVIESGLARLSARERVHAHFRSRIMFPIRDLDGRVLGFAGRGTHLGASWPLWITSPDGALYRRSHAVFGMDRAESEIASSSAAVVRRDCLEVLQSHQDGQRNAVTVHSSEVTFEQLEALAAGVAEGIEELELEVPPGMHVETEPEPEGADLPLPAGGREAAEVRPPEPPKYLTLKRTGLVIATALAAVNAWTGAPLLSIWVGSQAQGGKVLSTRGVLTVIVVLSILTFFIGWALTWLSAKYDQLTGRPRLAGLTSPWHRAKRGDRVQDIRSRYGISAPEKVVAASVITGILAFEVWFFFIAGSPFGG